MGDEGCGMRQSARLRTASRFPHPAALHLPILRPRPAFARSPARAEYVSGFTIDTVGGAHDQTIAVALIYASGTHVRVELGDLGLDVGADDQVRRNVVARCIA